MLDLDQFKLKLKNNFVFDQVKKKMFTGLDINLPNNLFFSFSIMAKKVNFFWFLAFVTLFTLSCLNLQVEVIVIFIIIIISCLFFFCGTYLVKFWVLTAKEEMLFQINWLFAITLRCYALRYYLIDERLEYNRDFLPLTVYQKPMLDILVRTFYFWVFFIEAKHYVSLKKIQTLYIMSLKATELTTKKENAVLY